MTKDEAMVAYKEKFDDLPTLIGISPDYDEDVAQVLQEAVEDDEPLSDNEFRAALGLDPIPAGADV